jgi:hypothetical protein
VRRRFRRDIIWGSWIQLRFTATDEKRGNREIREIREKACDGAILRLPTRCECCVLLCMNTKVIFPEESYKIVGACFEVYKEKGCGFLESVLRIKQENRETQLKYVKIFG